MLREVAGGVRGDDPSRGADEIHGKRGVGFLEVEDDREGIRSVDGSDQTEGAALGRVVRGIEDVIEGEFDVGGGERAGVVKMDAGMEVKDVGARVGSVPRVGEVAVEVHLGVALKQAAEEEAVDPLGVGVGGVTRIEVRRIGFD
jgi:hypothetical protein